MYDTIFSGPGPDALGYVVLSGNGSGHTGAPLRPEVKIVDSQWQTKEDHLRSKPPSIFGFRISRGAYGFGPYILERASTPIAPQP